MIKQKNLTCKIYKLLTVLVICVTLFFLESCKKEKDELSFVDDYNPILTDSIGTIYDGEYFPFDLNYNWDWDGSATMDGKLEGSPFNNTESVYSTMYVVSNDLIALNSGMYNVYRTSETEGVERYFEKTDTSVNLRAINNLDGSNELIEVKNPCYIRKPLIVGQQWNAQPQLDSKLLTSFDGLDISNLRINCKFFVIGKEKLVWNNEIKYALRLDQRAEISGKVSYNESGQSGNLNISATISINLYLLQNIGIVKQKEDLQFNTSGDLNMYFNMISEITLTYYSLDNSNFYQTKPLYLKSEKINGSDIDRNKTRDKLLKFFKTIKNIGF